MDPETGRWLSVDALSVLDPGISLYAYVANNPLSRIGPDGRFWQELINMINGLGWRKDEEINKSASEESGKALESAEEKYEQKSTEYTKDAPPRGEWKCNKFVGDAYTEGAGLDKSVDGKNDIRLIRGVINMPVRMIWLMKNINLRNLK